MNVVESDSASGSIGAHFRSTRPGPELDLIDSFLMAMPLGIPQGCRATIFREPRLESGFPDIVIVVWREEITSNWRSARTSLNTYDHRIMHFIYNSRRVRQDEIATYFGKRASESVGRLHDAGMIRLNGFNWHPLALRRSFAAVKIIAVEAKIGKWKNVLNQAILNTWFASKSYILVSRSPSRKQIEEAQSYGIGVCSLENGKVKEVASNTAKLPRSYASWMLNDWAWRSAK